QARRAERLGGALIALAIGLAIAGPWYARNLSVYGTLFALEVGFGPTVAGRASVESLAQMIIGTMRYFWMPMTHVPGTVPVHDLRVIDGALILLHVAAALVWLRRAKAGAGALLLVALLALTFGAHLGLNLRWADSEGRLLCVEV